jgi:hypothetical protein
MLVRIVNLAKPARSLRPSNSALRILATATATAACGPVRFALLLCLGSTLLAQTPRIHAAAISPPRTATAVLTQVRQVRNLSPRQASQSVPVSIRGIVTGVPGWRNSFFVQDATAGISVDRADHAEVRVGDRVQVTGVSNPGLFAPLIMASRVVVEGHGPPPPARRVAYADMAGGAKDSQWIEVSGVVHSTRPGKLFGRDVLMLTLDIGGGSLSVTLQDVANLDPKTLTDSTLLLRGVGVTAFNEKRQFVGLGLLVPERGDLEVAQAANVDPFAMAATPVRDLFQFGQTPHRLKVRGVATYQIPGHALYMQDGADGIIIQTAAKDPVRPGSLVEAVGFPSSGNYAPMLEDGILRVVGMGAPAKPPRIRARDAIAITGQPDVDPPPCDEQLVQIEATVVESHAEGGQQVWTMRQDKQIFEARMAATPAETGGALAPVGVGSVLALTGICEIQINSDHVPVSFSLLVRTPGDVVVLKHASWWTAVNALIVVASLSFVAILTILWLPALRPRGDR